MWGSLRPDSGLCLIAFLGLVGMVHNGSPVVPFYPFSFWVPLLKPNSSKKGTLIIKELLGNLDIMVSACGIAVPGYLGWRLRIRG